MILESVNRLPASSGLETEQRALEILRFLLQGRGGSNRMRILRLLAACPRNAHAIARQLELNYGTVTLHLRTLVAAGLVQPITQARYSQGFALAPVLRKHTGEIDGPEEPDGHDLDALDGPGAPPRTSVGTRPSGPREDDGPSVSGPTRPTTTSRGTRSDRPRSGRTAPS